MRVLILTHNYPQSRHDRKNAGAFVHDFAKVFSRKASLEVFTPLEKGISAEIEGIKVSGFKWNTQEKLGNLKFYNPLDIYFFVSYFIKGFWGLRKYFGKQTKIDYVISMWAFPSGLFAYLLKIIKRVPYGIWALGSDINVYGKLPVLKQIITLILQKADLLFADGIVLAKDVKQIAKKECYFIPSASDFDIPRFLTKKNDKKIVFTFLGRLEKVKGPDILLDSLEHLKNFALEGSIKNIKVYMIGGGSMWDELKHKIKRYGLENCVEMTGNIDDKNKIVKILSISDWLIIPSRSDSIPIVFSEAMKLCVPVIASDLEDLNYLIKKYKVGYNFRSGSFIDLANVLEKVIKNKNITRDMIKRCKVAAIDFDIKSSGDKIYQLISKNE